MTQPDQRAACSPPAARLVTVTATLRHALRALMVTIVFAVLAAVVVGRFVLHLGMSPVLSGSMRPTFAPGDAVITRVIPVSNVHPGSIAVFVPPGQSGTFAHRVVTVKRSSRGSVITTKGDANPVPDAWHAVLPGPHVAVVVAHVPKIGYALVALRQRQWRAALIGLLGLVMTFVATRSVLRVDPAGPSVAQSARL